MTDIRTYPKSASIEKDTQLTIYNFADNQVTRPAAYYNNPSGIVVQYGRRPDYYNHGPGKTSWDGSKGYQAKVLDDNSNPVNPSNVSVGWVRRFYPGTEQLWDWSLGLNANVVIDLLLDWDWAHERGMKVDFIFNLFNQESKVSTKAFGYALQNSALYEERIIAYLTAFFDSTQTSPLGYTIANHPALGAVECGNEDIEVKNDNGGTFMAGNIHANIDRIVKLIVQNKAINTYRAEPIKVIAHSSKGSLPIDITIIMGGEAVSQADTVLGTGTLASSTITLAGHTLENYDEVLFEAADFLDTYAQRTPYFIINPTATTFQLSLTEGGGPITPASTDGIMNVFRITNAYTDAYAQSDNTNLVSYSASTNTFTQTAFNGAGLSTKAKALLVGCIGSTSTDSGISVYRRYYVRDVVAGTSFKVSDSLLGEEKPNALTFTGTANVVVRKHTPAPLFGDTGESRNTTHYIDVENVHMYGTMTNALLLTDANNKQQWSATIFNHEEAGFVPFMHYQKFGMDMRGPVTASGAVFTSTKKLNLTADSRIKLSGTTLPGGTARDVLYYAVNINNATKTFGVSLTKNGTAITTTTAGASIYVSLAHPYYGKKERPPLWNTESSENGVQVTRVHRDLTPTQRFDFYLAHCLSRLMKTDDGNGGCGVTVYFGSELSPSVLGEMRDVTLGSNGGNLEITLSASFGISPVIGNHMVNLFTGANAIPGILPANGFGEFLVIGGSGTTLVLDVPYTGGNVAGVEATLDDSFFFSAGTRRAVIQHLISAPIKFGFCTLDTEFDRSTGTEVRGALWYALEGIGAWYFDHTGVRHQW